MGGFLSAVTMSKNTLVSSPQNAQFYLQSIRSKTNANVNSLPVPHHVYNSFLKKWIKRSPPSSPTLNVSVTLDRQAYKDLKLNLPEMVKKAGAGHARNRTATTDSGAQLTVINENELSVLGIKKFSLFPLATSVNTVTKASVDLIGGVFLTFSVYNESTGAIRKTQQMCYISKSVPGIYLSEDACKALGCLPSTFPMVGEFNEDDSMSKPSISALKKDEKCKNFGVAKTNDVSEVVCQCPRRTLPPTDKPVLPCELTVENLPITKQYILDRYASSAFNCCEHQPLPLMSKSPPLRLFVDKQASPVAVSTPIKIPHHWVQEVKNGLDRDERLGVIERVPVNEPLKWCSVQEC